MYHTKTSVYEHCLTMLTICFNATQHILVTHCVCHCWCTHDVHIVNGRLHGDTDGHYTCTANDGKSLVDYVIGSTQLFNYCTDFNIESEDFSDHFPVCCRLTFQSTKGYDETMN